VEGGYPGIARANRARRGAFSTLIEHALGDPDALDALVFAYEALPVAERLRMARAVVQDAERPGPALATLLTVESNPSARALLAELLRQHASANVAFLSGTELCGEAWLRDVDRDGARDSLRIAWNDQEITELEVKAEDVSSFSGRATTRDAALELIAPMLWRHLRRGGELPPGLARFARYF